MIYCYRRRDNGHIVEVTMTVAEMKAAGDVIEIDGVKADRDMPAEISGVRDIPSCWPLKSRAAGVPKHQIKEAGDSLARAGIPTDFTDTGEIVFRDRRHRSEVLEHIGMYDANAGYGDRAPGQRVR